MGRTRRPLTIVVDPEWVDHPAVRALVAKGHTVVALQQQADLILSRVAHAWDEAWWEWLDVAVRGAQHRRAR